jgi:hypothetical protein
MEKRIKERTRKETEVNMDMGECKISDTRTQDSRVKLHLVAVGTPEPTAFA